MGTSGAWLVAKGQIDDVLATCGGRKISELEFEAFNYSNSAQQRGEWTAIWSADEQMFSPAFLALFSQSFEAYSGIINETVMWVDIHHWKSGHKMWRVEHDGDVIDRDHLVVEGEPPKELESIVQNLRDKREAKGDEYVDYFFSIPSHLADAIFGFCYEDFIDSLAYEISYEPETPALPPKKSFFRCLFPNA